MNERSPGKEDRRNEGFDELLNFLVCNRSVKGMKPWEIEELQGHVYEQIRRKLIRLFRWRGSETPEELVDKTFDRVSQKLPDLPSFVGDPAHYVSGVGRLIFLESLRKRRLPELPTANEGDEEEEEALDCLDHCLEAMRPTERELILEYYKGEKRAKIAHRDNLANRLGTSANALRIQTCRIRTRLRKCVMKCLEEK